MSAKTGKSYTSSKGERYNVSRKVTNSIKKDRTYLDTMLLKQKAWLNGRNPWLTIENPNPNETNKKFIRVKALNHWGSPNPKREKEEEKVV